MNSALRPAPPSARHPRSTLLLSLFLLLAAGVALSQPDPGQPPANPLQDARDALRKRLLDNELWHGQVRVVIQGSGQRSSGSDQRSYSIHREAEITFRIPVVSGESEALSAMEQAMKASPGVAGMLGAHYERLRNVRHWVSASTNRKPGDEDDVHLLVADRTASSGTEACGNPPDTYDDRFSLDGADDRKAAGMHMLEIDLGKGTYTLTMDGRSEQLTLTEVESHTGQPEKRTVRTGNATGVAMLVRDHPLPSEGSVLTGMEAIPKDKLRSLVRLSGMDFGSLQGAFTWTLSPVPFEDVELVLEPEGYADWMPRGGRDENTPGNSIRAKVVLRRRDGGGAATAKLDRLTVRIADASSEPGVCLNHPLGNGAVSPDLRFAAAAGANLEDGGTRLRTQGLNSTEFAFTVDCYDWGAYGALVAEAMLTDGRQVYATLAGDPSVTAVRLPKREERSKVADKWKADMAVEDEADTADRDVQTDNRNVGDGLTLYEEYRGLIARGKHTRDHAPGPDGFRPLTPGRKDLIVDNTIKHPLLPSVIAGLRLFEKEAHVHVVEVDATELDASRQVNLNLGKLTAGPQHGLRLVDEKSKNPDAVGESQGMPAKVGSAVLGGSPAGWAKIVVDLEGERQVHAGFVGKCRLLSIRVPHTLEMEIATTVAHELAHGLGVQHHGSDSPVAFASTTVDATNNVSLVVYNRDGSVITTRPFLIEGTIGDAGNSASGDVNCVMCYNNVWSWSYVPGDGIYLAPVLAVGGTFCKSSLATGTNAPRLSASNRTLPGMFGRATAGNCLGQMRVKDQR